MTGEMTAEIRKNAGLIHSYALDMSTPLDPLSFGATYMAAAAELERLRAEIDRMREPRPLNAVDQLAIQTSYASVAFIAAHLRAYFVQLDVAPIRIPGTVLDAAERTVRVLDQMRQGDQEQWGHIVETMTRAANLLSAVDLLLLDDRMPVNSRDAKQLVIDLREAVEWMRGRGGAS